MRRAVIVAGALLLTSVVLTELASGAMCLRWEEPGPLRVDRPIVVAFRTLVPVVLEDGTTRMEPNVVTDYPFRVRVRSPDGTARRLAVSSDPTDPQRWSGRFSPDREGTWILSVTNFAGVSEPACYSPLHLVVRGPADVVSAPFPAVIGAILLLVIGVAVGIGLQRREAHRSTV